MYEGDANNDDVHGGTQAAPIVGRVMREVFKNEPRGGKTKKKRTRVIENEDGEMVEVEEETEEPDQPRARRTRRSIPEERVAPPPPPQPQPRRERGVPFFRRLFGF